jgi:hypothetical protein
MVMVEEDAAGVVEVAVEVQEDLQNLQIHPTHRTAMDLRKVMK